MTEETPAPTLRLPPWLLVVALLLGGGGVAGIGTGIGSAASSRTADQLDEVARLLDAHEAQGGHGLTLHRLDAVEAETSAVRDKLDKLHDNQITICAALEVDCLR